MNLNSISILFLSNFSQASFLYIILFLFCHEMSVTVKHPFWILFFTLHFLLKPLATHRLVFHGKVALFSDLKSVTYAQKQMTGCYHRDSIAACKCTNMHYHWCLWYACLHQICVIKSAFELTCASARLSELFSIRTGWTKNLAKCHGQNML